MHSSRMPTAHSSSHHRGVSTPSRSRNTPTPPKAGTPCPPARFPSTSPLGVGLEQIPLNYPLGYGPGPDPPQLPPWVWAWSPPKPDPPKLPPWVWACKPARHAGIPPPAWRPAARHAGIPPTMHVGIASPLWTEFLPHTSENITLPKTSFAGGKNWKCVSIILHKYILY